MQQGRPCRKRKRTKRSSSSSRGSSLMIKLGRLADNKKNKILAVFLLLMAMVAGETAATRELQQSFRLDGIGSDLGSGSSHKSWRNSGEISVVGKRSGLGARFILHPPEVRFAFGFFTSSRPGAFVLAIFLYPHRSSRHRRRVWCASDGNQVPVLVGEDAALELRGNNMVLLDSQRRRIVWSSSSISSAASTTTSTSLDLRDDGNLMLRDERDGSVVWESFRHPVDVLLPGQILASGMQLS